MNRIALIGSGIGYTRSPEIHAAISEAAGIDVKCEAVDISDRDLKSTVDALLQTHAGFFVTKPYKTLVKDCIGCYEAGAVNVVRSRDKKAVNTDTDGFMLALDRDFNNWRKDVKSALILGAGGAAWAAATALISANVKVYVLARSAIPAAKLCKITGAELYVNQPVQLAVNCTSAGTDDDVLLRLCVIPDFKYAYEMYYAADSTPFTLRAANAGSMTAMGLDMLIYQAIIGDKFITEQEFDTQAVFEKVKQIVSRQ